MHEVDYPKYILKDRSNNRYVSEMEYRGGKLITCLTSSILDDALRFDNYREVEKAKKDLEKDNYLLSYPLKFMILLIGE